MSADGNGDRGDGGPAGPETSRDIVVKVKERGPRRLFASAGFLLDAARRRKGGRIALWGLVVALALGGIGLLTYPFITHWWAKRIQGRLETQFGTPGSVQAYKAHSIPVGGALTRIKIPKLGVDVIVVEGVTGNALRAGAGHYPDTPLPGELGNVAIAGHRTGFGQPFRHVERLREGDEIILETPVGTFRYEVVGPFDGHRNPWITRPDAWEVLDRTPYAALTLTTCDPPNTSKNRLIVRARLVT